MSFFIVAGTGIEPVNSLLYYKTNITHYFPVYSIPQALYLHQY